MAGNDTSANGAQDRLAAALAALNTAIDKLDDAVDAHLNEDAEERSVDEQVQRMAEDRAKLARDLDASQARVQSLSGVNGEVSRRLVDVMETVREVLDDTGSGGKGS